MYLLETEQTFDAAHFLKGYNGKCSNIHGHRWRVVARIARKDLSDSGTSRAMVMDFSDFKEMLRQLTEAFDHTLIIETGSLKNTTLAALLEEEISITEVSFRPTAEEFAAYFYRQLRKMSCPVYEVAVYESPANCAIYREGDL